MTKKEIKNYLLEDYLYNLEYAVSWFKTWTNSGEELHTSNHRIYISYYTKSEHDLEMLNHLNLITYDEWNLYWDIMQNAIFDI